MNRLLTAWHFLCIIPLPGVKPDNTSEELGASMAFFPVVGSLFGLFLIVFFKLFSLIWSAAVSSTLTICLLSILSGGIHLDGLADTADGIYGGRSKEQILNIMRDVHIGAIGAVALVFNLLVKVKAASCLPHALMVPAFFLTPVFGRWSMVVASFFSEYARLGEGLGKAFTDFVTYRVLVVSTGTTFCFTLAFLGFLGLELFFVMGICTLLLIFYFKRKIGGVTGDTLGCCNELIESLCLLFLCAS